MNSNNIGKTIIQTWDDEFYIIDVWYEDFLEFINNQKNLWQDWFNSQKYQTFIKFKNIKSISWDKKILKLPPREAKFYELSHTEKQELLERDPEKYYRLESEDIERRRKIQAVIEKIPWLSEEEKMKRRLERRNEILKDLEKMERSWWIETTLSKLEKYNILINKEKIEKLKNEK